MTSGYRPALLTQLTRLSLLGSSIFSSLWKIKATVEGRCFCNKTCKKLSLATEHRPCRFVVMCSHWISIGFPDYWRVKWNKCPRHSENPALVDRFPFGQSITVHNEFNNQFDLLDWILCIWDTHTPIDSGFLCMYEYRPRNKAIPTGELFLVDPFLW